MLREKQMVMDTMSGVIAYDPIPVLLGVGLERGSDITDAVIRPALLDPEHQAFFGDADQLLQLVNYFTDGHSDRGISDKPFESTRHVE